MGATRYSMLQLAIADSQIEIVKNGCVGLLNRPANSGGTQEPSSQKEFGFAESFFDFEVFTELNSKNVSEITAKIICFA